MLLHRDPFHTGGFTRKPFTVYTQKLVHAEALAQSRLYTERPLHRAAFTHRSFDTEQFEHANAFTRRNFYTQAPLHTEALTHRCCYTRETFAQSSYRQTLLHTEAFTQKRLFTEQPFNAKARSLQRVATQKQKRAFWASDTHDPGRYKLAKAKLAFSKHFWMNPAKFTFHNVSMSNTRDLRRGFHFDGRRRPPAAFRERKQIRLDIVGVL